MNDCVKAALEVNKKILKSPEYLNYVIAKGELAKYPNYKERVDNFRKRQVSHEAAKKNCENINENEEFALANDYADICLITVCNDFFQAEMECLSLIKDIYKAIYTGVAIDIEL